MVDVAGGCDLLGNTSSGNEDGAEVMLRRVRVGEAAGLVENYRVAETAAARVRAALLALGCDVTALVFVAALSDAGGPVVYVRTVGEEGCTAGDTCCPAA